MRVLLRAVFLVCLLLPQAVAASPGLDIVVVAHRGSGPSDLVLVDPETGRTCLLLPSADAGDQPSAHRAPHWSGDGAWIAFASLMPERPPDHPEMFEAGPGIYRIDAEGHSLCRIAPLRAFAEPEPAWSPTAQQIVYADLVLDRPCTGGRCPQWDLFRVDAACGATPVNLTRTPERDERFPAWSPDGRWVAASVGPSDPGVPHVQDLAVFEPGPDRLEEVFRPGRPDGCLAAVFSDWSRQGDRLAACCVAEDDPSSSLWLFTLADRAWTRLTAFGERGLHPTWSPGDGLLAFDHEDGPELRVRESVPGPSGRTLSLTPEGVDIRYMGPDWRRAGR